MNTSLASSSDDTMLRVAKSALLAESMVMVGGALSLRTPQLVLCSVDAVAGWLALCVAQTCVQGRTEGASSRGKRFARCVFSPSTYRL